VNIEPFFWDKAIFLRINEWGQGWLDYLCGWPTHLGDPIILIFITGSLMLVWDEKNTVRKIAVIAIGAILASLIANMIKPHIFRPRPYLYYRELIDSGVYQLNALFDLLVSESSFPSGHTATIFGCITVTNCFYRHRFWLLYFIGAFIGFTRIYVGVHYPSDVIAGALVGFLTGLVTYSLFDRIFKLKQNNNQASVQ